MSNHTPSSFESHLDIRTGYATASLNDDAAQQVNAIHRAFEIGKNDPIGTPIPSLFEEIPALKTAWQDGQIQAQDIHRTGVEPHAVNHKNYPAAESHAARIIYRGFQILDSEQESPFPTTYRRDNTLTQQLPPSTSLSQAAKQATAYVYAASRTPIDLGLESFTVTSVSIESADRKTMLEADVMGSTGQLEWVAQKYLTTLEASQIREQAQSMFTRADYERLGDNHDSAATLRNAGEQIIRRMEGAVLVAGTNEQYSGSIVAMNDSHLIQKDEHGTLVQHQRRHLVEEKGLAIGQNVNIRYGQSPIGLMSRTEVSHSFDKDSYQHAKTQAERKDFGMER